MHLPPGSQQLHRFGRFGHKINPRVWKALAGLGDKIRSRTWDAYRSGNGGPRDCGSTFRPEGVSLQTRRPCRGLSGVNGKRGIQYADGQVSRYREGYRSSIQSLWCVCARWPGRQGRCRREKRPQAPRRGLCRSTNAVLPADCSLVWTAFGPSARLPGLPWMHPAPEPLGQALLQRRESGNTSVDLSLANVPCHRAPLKLPRYTKGISEIVAATIDPGRLTHAFLPPGAREAPQDLRSSEARTSHHSSKCKARGASPRGTQWRGGHFQARIRPIDSLACSCR